MRRFALLLPLALAACHHEPPAEPPAAAPAARSPAETPASGAPAERLQAHHWRLQAATDAAGARIDDLFVDGGEPLTADFRDGRIALSGGCNRGSAAYAPEGDTLRVERFAQTLMACADDRLMRLDAAATQRLAGTLRWNIEDGGEGPALRLVDGDGATLTFVGEPTAETRYGGPGETVFMEVAPERVACSHPLMPDHRCLRVRELHYDANGLRAGEPGEWQPLYEEIEGYAHEPGIRNVLRLKRYRRENAPADASSVAYVHDMTVESEAVR